jgi:arabinogalactan endo-1,4-beta-galactosidase
MKKSTLLMIILVIVLGSCSPAGQSAPTGTLSPAATATPVPLRPTDTPTATNIPTPTITLTPTSLDYSLFPQFSPCIQDEDGGSVEIWKCPYQKRNDFFVGGWVTDYLAIREWNVYWKQADPLDVMKANGFQWVKTCMRTESSQYLANTPFDQWGTLPWRDEYWSSLEYSAQILKEAASKGYHLDLCFFLSDQAADAGRQYTPKEWAKYNLEETAHALEEYTYQTTLYFKQLGLNIDLYEIGNEIEWGIVGYTPDDRIPRPNNEDKTMDIAYMENSVWNKEAFLLKAAINGVKRADPQAKTVLHVDSMMAFNNDDNIAKYFFKTMVDQQVPFDYAGLSNTYPNPGWFPGGRSRDWYFSRLLRTVDFIAALGKPVIFSEGGYSSFQYQDGILPITDYPFTPQGQAAWVRDQLRFASNHPDVKGFFYFYPDWFPHDGTGQLQSSGLFANDQDPRPGLSEFRVALP